MDKNTLQARAAAMQEREKKDRDEGFARFMAAQPVKLMLSLVQPAPGAPPEVMETLLRSAFDAGVQTGTSNIMGEIINSMMGEARRG